MKPRWLLVLALVLVGMLIGKLLIVRETPATPYEGLQTSATPPGQWRESGAPETAIAVDGAGGFAPDAPAASPVGWKPGDLARVRDALAQPSREHVVEAQRILQAMPYLDQFRVLDSLALEGDEFASATASRIARECRYVARYLSAAEPELVGPRPNAMLAHECDAVLASVPMEYLEEVAGRFRPVDVPKAALNGLSTDDAMAAMVANELAASEVVPASQPPATASQLLNQRDKIYAQPERFFTSPRDFLALGTASAKQRVIRYAEALAQCDGFGLCTSRSAPAYQLCFLPAAQCLPGDDVRTIATRNLPPHELRLAQDLAQGLVREYRDGG
jgi:hypothetical protein